MGKIKLYFDFQTEEAEETESIQPIHQKFQCRITANPKKNTFF